MYNKEDTKLQGRRHAFRSGGYTVIFRERSERKKFLLYPPRLTYWGVQSVQQKIVTLKCLTLRRFIYLNQFSAYQSLTR